jgi:DNA polymerase-3 subunit alpha
MKFNCGCNFEILDFDNVNLECPASWDLLANGLTKGLFQIEKQLGRRFCKAIQPSNIEELAAVISLIRPGCLEAEYREDPTTGKMLNITDTYVKVKSGELRAEYIDPILESILGDTMGVPVYQEQIMRICTDFAGFTMEDADTARKAMGKKNTQLFEKIKESFILGAIKKGYDVEKAETIWSWIEKFSGYGFNKCVLGDTILDRGMGNQHSDGLYTVEYLYKLVNDYQYAKNCKQIPLRKKLRSSGYGNCMAVCGDGRLRPMPIKTIHFNGKKKIVRVTDNGGRGISCTIDHKFMTPDGTMKAIGEIGVGGEVLCHIDCYDDEYTYNYNMHNEADRGNPNSLTNTIGRKNASFINGNWAAFKEVKDKNWNINYCQICFTKPNRLEWHHIDGDRSNNTDDNLIKLCVSCHKKEDYKLGRNKRFDKGHKTGVAIITSIEEFSETFDTYDVEMDTPEHNWIANGFVVSNSHAVSYAILGYWGAYSKVHFPIEFFKNKLAFSDSNPDEFDEIKQLVYEAKLFNINVLPPNVNTCNNQFAFTENNDLIFGLSHIKGVGIKSLEDVEKLKNIETSYDLFKRLFIDEIKIKKNVVQSLIKCGAFDIPIDRTVLLARYEFLISLTDRERDYLFENDKVESISVDEMLATLISNNIPRGVDRINKLSDGWNLTKKSLGGNRKRMALAWEKHYLGMPLSGSEVELYNNWQIDTTCQDFLNLKHGDKVKIGVIIEEIREIKDKNGGLMCFMKVSDSTYMMDGVTVFTRQYNKLGWIIEEGKAVLIKGKKSDNSRGTGLLVDSIEHL